MTLQRYFSPVALSKGQEGADPAGTFYLASQVEIALAEGSTRRQVLEQEALDRWHCGARENEPCKRGANYVVCQSNHPRFETDTEYQVLHTPDDWFILGLIVVFAGLISYVYREFWR